MNCLRKVLKPLKPLNVNVLLFSSSSKGKGFKSPSFESNGKSIINATSSQLSTIFDIYRYAVTTFTKNDLSYGHTTTTSWEDAAFLIMHELHLPHCDPITHWGNAKLLPSEKEHLLTLIQQRVKTKKPTPYLVKGCYQQGEYFYVDERVLIPRSYIGEILKTPALIGHIDQASSSNSSSPSNQKPIQELELDYGDYIGEIVDETKVRDSNNNATAWFSTKNLKPQPQGLYHPDKIKRVLDLCTGSGCLAILAAKYFPNIEHIDAVDISPAALEVATMNIEAKDLDHLIHLHVGDLFDALPKDGLHKYDLILTNPPYVTTEDMQDLPEEYLHEPGIALEAGKDGLAVVRKIVRKAGHYLNEEGGLLCEFGQCKPAFMKVFGKQLEGQQHLQNASEKKIHWIATSQSKDEVFYMNKKALVNLK